MPAALSVIVPNFRRPDLLRTCLPSVLDAAAACSERVEVIVVDDGSGDESAEFVRREFPEVRVVALAVNRGYPAAVNAGVAGASAPWILTLNNDTTVDRRVFDELLAVARSAPDVGSVAALQLFASTPSVIYSAGLVVDRRGQNADRLMGEPTERGDAEPVEVFGACGAAALYRRDMLDEVGGFDERFRFGLEDADVAWRARMRGWRCLYAPGAIVYHDLGGTVPHGSPLRLHQAGRNRLLLIARNMDGRQLRRNLPRIVAFDLAYVLYGLVRLRSVEPLRGRVAGLRLWRGVRREAAAERRPVGLAAPTPYRTVLARRRAWSLGGSHGRSPHQRNERALEEVPAERRGGQ
jgi:GT2 family glycosyltransferase